MDAYAQVENDVDLAIELVKELSSTEKPREWYYGQLHVMITPSCSKEYEWRRTTFIDSEACGHSEFHTYQKAIEQGVFSYGLK